MINYEEANDMNMRAIITTIALTLTVAPALADQGRITAAGSQPTVIGPEEYFTGTAFVEPRFDSNEVRNFAMASVTFLPGARSNWHTHLHGQTLVVTSGTGWTQVQGGERHTIRFGDVVWYPPGVNHWHGATDTTAMSHLAIQEAENGSLVEWVEPVTDEQFLGE